MPVVKVPFATFWGKAGREKERPQKTISKEDTSKQGSSSSVLSSSGTAGFHSWVKDAMLRCKAPELRLKGSHHVSLRGPQFVETQARAARFIHCIRTTPLVQCRSKHARLMYSEAYTRNVKCFALRSSAQAPQAASTYLGASQVRLTRGLFRAPLKASKQYTTSLMKDEVVAGSPGPQEDVKFYTHTLCPYAHRVALTLIEKGKP